MGAGDTCEWRGGEGIKSVLSLLKGVNSLQVATYLRLFLFQCSVLNGVIGAAILSVMASLVICSVVSPNPGLMARRGLWSGG